MSGSSGTCSGSGSGSKVPRPAVVARAFSDLPIELKQLIRAAGEDEGVLSTLSSPSLPPPALSATGSAATQSLADKLALIEKKKLLELEHYLRVCSLRLFGSGE